MAALLFMFATKREEPIWTGRQREREWGGEGGGAGMMATMQAGRQAARTATDLFIYIIPVKLN